jgi:flagellar motor switch protein FliN
MITATANPELARAAAEAAADLLPASVPLIVGVPSSDPATVSVAGLAVSARITGAAQGEIVVVVAQDLVDALQNTPLGTLDLAKAVQPALEAAAASIGSVVVDPGQSMSPEAALTALAGKPEAMFVPLTDGQQVRAAVALAVVSTASAVGTTDAFAGTFGAGVAGEAAGEAPRRGLDLLHDVEMEVTAELGRTRMSVRELLSIAPGAVVELDRAAGAPTDLLVNGRLIARGEVVVIDENFGLRITEIVGTPGDRDRSAA